MEGLLVLSFMEDEDIRHIQMILQASASADSIEDKGPR